MAKAFQTGDEVFKADWYYQPHEDRLYRNLTQPTEDLILNRNKELRKNPDAVDRDKMEGFRWAASVPMAVWENAKKEGYELDCPDKAKRERERARFFATPIGKACLIGDSY